LDGFAMMVSDVEGHILKLASYRYSTSEQSKSPASAIRTIDEKLKQLIEAESVKGAYRHTDIALASHRISLLPSQFNTLQGKQLISSVTLTTDEDDFLLDNELQSNGPVCMSLVSGYLKDQCSEIFRGAVIMGASAVFAASLLRKNREITYRQVFINIHRLHFEICITQGPKLLYLNVFKYSSPSDVLYYTVFVLEQLGFVPAEETLVLMGENAENVAIVDRLQLYCSSVQFASAPDGIVAGQAMSGIGMHQYFTLLSIPACGL
jgi:hypothetical protein